MESDRGRLMDAGFDAYLSKPLHKADIDALLEKWAGEDAKSAKLA